MSEVSIDSIPFDIGGTSKFFDTVDDLPEEYGPPSSLSGATEHEFFTSLSDLPSYSTDDPNDPLQQKLAATQELRRKAEELAAHEKITRWLSTFHGDEPDSANSLRGQVDRGKISGSDYYAMTGRIYAGGGRPASSGLTTGTMSTGGLDALADFQSRSLSDSGRSVGGDPFAGALSFSDDRKGPPLPGSIASAVGAPAPGMALVGSTASFGVGPHDWQAPGQYGKAGTAGSYRVFAPVTPGTANAVTRQF